MLQSDTLQCIEFSTFVLGFSRKVVYFHFFKGWHLLHTVRFREYPLNDLMPNHLEEDFCPDMAQCLGCINRPTAPALYKADDSQSEDEIEKELHDDSRDKEI